MWHTRTAGRGCRYLSLDSVQPLDRLKPLFHTSTPHALRSPHGHHRKATSGGEGTCGSLPRSLSQGVGGVGVVPSHLQLPSSSLPLPPSACALAAAIHSRQHAPSVLPAQQKQPQQAAVLIGHMAPMGPETAPGANATSAVALPQPSELLRAASQQPSSQAPVGSNSLTQHTQLQQQQSQGQGSSGTLPSASGPRAASGGCGASPHLQGGQHQQGSMAGGLLQQTGVHGCSAGGGCRGSSSLHSIERELRDGGHRERDHREAREADAMADNGGSNGKNGSDSGSNSPDETGGGGVGGGASGRAGKGAGSDESSHGLHKGTGGHGHR